MSEVRADLVRDEVLTNEILDSDSRSRRGKGQALDLVRNDKSLSDSLDLEIARKAGYAGAVVNIRNIVKLT